MSDTSDAEVERINETAFDGRVRKWTKSGWKRDVEMLTVEEQVNQKHATLGANGTADVKRYQKRAEFREEHAYSLMLALASHLGSEVSPK
jgi:hypothetical protein